MPALPAFEAWASIQESWSPRGRLFGSKLLRFGVVPLHAPVSHGELSVIVKEHAPASYSLAPGPLDNSSHYNRMCSRAWLARRARVAGEAAAPR